MRFIYYEFYQWIWNGGMIKNIIINYLDIKILRLKNLLELNSNFKL